MATLKIKRYHIGANQNWEEKKMVWGPAKVYTFGFDIFA